MRTYLQAIKGDKPVPEFVHKIVDLFEPVADKGHVVEVRISACRRRRPRAASKPHGSHRFMLARLLRARRARPAVELRRARRRDDAPESALRVCTSPHTLAHELTARQRGHHQVRRRRRHARRRPAVRRGRPAGQDLRPDVLRPSGEKDAGALVRSRLRICRAADAAAGRRPRRRTTARRRRRP